MRQLTFVISTFMAQKEDLPKRMSGLKIHEDDLKLLYEEDTKQLEGLPSPLKPAPAASTPTPSTSASSSNRDSDTLDKVNTFMDNAIVQLIT